VSASDRVIRGEEIADLYGVLLPVYEVAVGLDRHDHLIGRLVEPRAVVMFRVEYDVFLVLDEEAFPAGLRSSSSSS
jgi:hypothetical protein